LSFERVEIAWPNWLRRVSPLRVVWAFAIAATIAAAETLTLSVPARDAALASTRELPGLLSRWRLSGNYLMQIAFALGAFVVEISALSWSRSSARRLAVGRSASGFADLLSFAIVHSHVPKIFARLAAVALVSIGALELHDRLAAPWPALVSLQAAPFCAQFVACFVLVGFFEYWCHRLQHADLFWPLHRFHHSADEFVILTAARKHPLEFWPELVISTAAVLLIGCRWDVVTAVMSIHTLINYMRHTRLDWRYGVIGRYLVQSPAHHRLHHERRSDDRSVNFGIMPVWDHLFGTWREAEKAEVQVGVVYPYRQGLGVFADLWRDAVDFWTGLVARPSTPARDASTD